VVLFLGNGQWHQVLRRFQSNETIRSLRDWVCGKVKMSRVGVADDAEPSCEMVQQWSIAEGFSTPVPEYHHGVMFHIRVSTRGAPVLPGGAVLAPLTSEERSLDMEGSKAVVMTHLDLAGKLDKGFSFAAWIMPEGVGSGEYAQAAIASIGYEFSLYYTCWGQLAAVIHLKGKGTQLAPFCEATTHYPVPTDRWSFVLLTVGTTAQGGTILRLFIDGKKHAEVTMEQRFAIMGRVLNPLCESAPESCPEFMSPLLIGNTPQSFEPFEGKIDDVAIWERPLSESEAAVLWEEHDGVPLYTDKSLLGAWNFNSLEIDSGTQLKVNDLSSRNNHALRLRGTNDGSFPALSVLTRPQNLTAVPHAKAQD